MNMPKYYDQAIVHVYVKCTGLEIIYKRQIAHLTSKLCTK